MYKQIKKIEEASLNSKKNKLYLYLREDEKLAEIDDFGNIKKEITFFDMKQVYRFSITDTNFIISFNDEKTIFYSNEGKELLTFQKQLYFSFLKENNTHIYIKNKAFLYRFHKEKYEIDIFPILEKPLFSCLYNDFLILKKEDTLYTYINEKLKISLLWEKNIHDFFNKEDSKDNQLQIQEIYVYKDNLVVVSTFGVLCLNPQDGSLIWKTESYARTMEIVGNFGYVCTSLSLYRVNLDNGEMYDYGREYADLPDFEYEGKTYWASGHRVVYNDGLLWYLVYSSGDSFVITIDPETANYQWIHKIDTYEKADEIEFHNDKMFISDTGGNLFIYERE